MKSFGSKLRIRAAELGLSNAEVARKLGLSERQYGFYVTGDRQPKLETLVRIAKALGTTPNALLGVGEQPGFPEMSGFQEQPGSQEFQGLQERPTKRSQLIARLRAATGMIEDRELDVLTVQAEALAARGKAVR